MKQTDISLNTTYLIDSAALEHLPSSVRNSILLPFPDCQADLQLLPRRGHREGRPWRVERGQLRASEVPC
jgi:hypothetical protein